MRCRETEAKRKIHEKKERRKINNTMRNQMVTKRTIFSTIFLHNEIATIRRDVFSADRHLDLATSPRGRMVLGINTVFDVHMFGAHEFAAFTGFRDDFCLHCRRKRSEMSKTRIATRQTVYNSIILTELANIYLKIYQLRRSSLRNAIDFFNLIANLCRYMSK